MPNDTRRRWRERQGDPWAHPFDEGARYNVWGGGGSSLFVLYHSLTFPRQARLLALFFLSGWRPAPEV